MQEYLLIGQDTPMIERHLRQPDGHWEMTRLDDMTAALTLPSIDCALALADVYAKVTF